MSGQEDLRFFSRPLQESCDSTRLRSSGSSEPERQLSQATGKTRHAKLPLDSKLTKQAASKQVLLCRPFET